MRSRGPRQLKHCAGDFSKSVLDGCGAIFPNGQKRGIFTHFGSESFVSLTATPTLPAEERRTPWLPES
jgi:hypothetical protein